MQIEIQDHSSIPAKLNVEHRDPFQRARLLRELLHRIASESQSSPDELKSRTTARKISRARGKFAYHAFVDLGVPIQAIAWMLNRKSHEAVRISISVYCAKNNIDYPPEFNGDYWLFRRHNQVARKKTA
jgi:hypothetical protein